MIKKSQLRELVRTIIQETMDTMGMDSSLSPTSIGGTDTATGGLTPVMQQKIAREKKLAAKKKVTADQKMLKKVDNDVKSLKSTYDVTRRLTKPNLKKQIDAEKQALSTMQ
jgi:hypothetical protein